MYARYHRLKGNNVLFVSGTDEHGTPIAVAADEEGVSPKEIVDRYNKVIRDDLSALGISYDLFTRTTTDNHEQVVGQIFSGLLANGLIKEEETVSAFAASGRALPDRYVEGTCPHCYDRGARGDQCDACGKQLDPQDLLLPRSKIDGATPVFLPTKHLFLDLPAVGDILQDFVSRHQDDWRPNVTGTSARLVEELRSRSITRDLEWGVPVPYAGYENKRFYVWFDAVIGYLSASIEWADRQGTPDAWRCWWQNPDAQHSYFLGKDNIVFHTVIWPAILAGYDGELGRLRLPDQVAASEFLTVEKQKFSSSRGITLYVRDALDKCDADALRYYLIAAGPETQDTDFTWEAFATRNNTELVANWGNLVQRTLSLAAKHFQAIPEPGTLTNEDKILLGIVENAFTTVGDAIEGCQFKVALRLAFEASSHVNKYFSDSEPWALVKEDLARAKTVLWVCLQAISDLRLLLAPFLPFSCQSLHDALGFEGSLSASLVNDDEQARLRLDERGVSHWGHELLPWGRVLNKPQALFSKLSEA